jgi:formate dehydrogenase subunit gamma
MMQTALELDVPESASMAIPADFTRLALPAALAPSMRHSSPVPSLKILRFAKSERILHWAIAGPFLVSFATGVILAVLYNPDPSRPWRGIFAVLHRASGIALSVFPMLALLSARRDVRIHLYNIKQAWTWIYDDFKWLALMGLAAVSSRFVLPEQGKFNAAEKLNFMVLMSTYPLYVVTGFLMWLIPLAVLSWIMHCLMAMMATPLILGHLYMALINADTRPGLEGMISGHVDRQWAKHHYRRWYRKHHESEEHPADKHLSVDPGFSAAVEFSVPRPEDFGSSPNAKPLTTLPPNTNGAEILSHGLEYFPQSMSAAEHVCKPVTPVSAVAGIAVGKQIGYEIRFDRIGPHSVRQTYDVWHTGLKAEEHNPLQTNLGIAAECLPGRILRIEIANKESGSYLSNELAPGCFLRLCGRLKKAEGGPALLCGGNHIKLFGTLGEQVNRFAYRNIPVHLAAGRIMSIAETSIQVMPVCVGACVLAPPLRAVLKIGDVSEFTPQAWARNSVRNPLWPLPPRRKRVAF